MGWPGHNSNAANGTTPTFPHTDRPTKPHLALQLELEMLRKTFNFLTLPLQGPYSGPHAVSIVVHQTNMGALLPHTTAFNGMASIWLLWKELVYRYPTISTSCHLASIKGTSHLTWCVSPAQGRWFLYAVPPAFYRSNLHCSSDRLRVHLAWFGDNSPSRKKG